MHRPVRTASLAIGLFVSAAFLASCAHDRSVAPESAPARLIQRSGSFLSATAMPDVRISEIHYDNTGTDAGERIEIAGPAGTDLTGWSVVLYNGSSGLVYDTDVLTGSIPATCGARGVIVISYPPNGIQNGSPDGIALVDNSGGVLEFLSYEGAMTGDDGPAAGLLSADIFAIQGGGDPVGSSLQRDGANVWSASLGTNTFGACNDNVILPPPPP